MSGVACVRRAIYLHLLHHHPPSSLPPFLESLPSACMTSAQSGSLVKTSGMTLQNAWGYKPLSIFLMALCTSDLVDETPRPA